MLLFDVGRASFGHFQVWPLTREDWKLKDIIKDMPSCNYLGPKHGYEVSWFDYKILMKALKLRGFHNDIKRTREFIARRNAIRTFLKRMMVLKSRTRTDWDINTALPLYDHQRVGAEFLIARRHAILADEMGVGKSLTAAAGAWELIKEGKINQALIVCPASVKVQWSKDTLKEFLPEATFTIVGADYRDVQDVPCPYTGQNVEALIGSRRFKYFVPRGHHFNPRRKPCRGCTHGPRCRALRGDTQSTTNVRLAQYTADTHFIIVNYELLRMDALGAKIKIEGKVQKDKKGNILRHPSAFESEGIGGWPLLICDEAHRLRNANIDTFEALANISEDALYRWALTGTPVQTRLEDAWGVMRWTNPGVLGTNRWRFLERYAVTHPIFKSKILRYRRVDEVHRKLAPNMMRRLKTEVLDLPPIVYSKHYVELTKDERGLYDNLKNQQVDEKQIADEVIRDGLNTCEPITTILKCRMAALSPALLNPDLAFDKGSKAKVMLEVLKDIIYDHKIIIFCEFSSFLKALSKTLTSKKIGHVFLHGGVTSGKNRDKLVKKFRTDDKCRCFLTTTAGGEGLNLQAADVLIFAHQTWNPSMTAQVIGRLHRGGQTKTVSVISLLSLDTIEERVDEDARFKATMSNEVVDGGELPSTPPISLKELRSML